MIPLFADLPPPYPEDVVKETIELFENVKEVQRDLLQNLLQQNASCEYLQRYLKDGSIDIQTFKERVPVIKYEDIEQDIQKVAQSAEPGSILSCQEIVYFHQSGGTSSGKFKMIPANAKAINQVWEFGVISEAWFRMTPSYRQLPTDGISMFFLFVGNVSTTPNGLEVANVTSYYARSSYCAYAQSPKSFASPLEVVLCKDFKQSMYCQLLCGLIKSSEVVLISSFLITILATAVTFLIENWEDMCKDIETGHLSSRITDEAVRRAVSEVLHAPNPGLARRIRAECSKNTWAGILIRLWPNLRIIQCICTGSMLQLVDHLEFLTEKKIPICSMLYVSSESAMAINPHPECRPKDVTYMFLPQVAFFEFRNIMDSSVVEISDVTVGEEYELVITTFSGLWRYRMGDILKCVGHFHSSPEFRVVGRENCLVSVAKETVYEYEIATAVESVARLHLLPGAQLSSYTSTVDVESLPGHYVVFWELEGLLPRSKDEHKEKFDECCLAIESSLNEKYRRDRNLGTIGALELILVKPGTFGKMIQEVQASQCSNQFKQARVYKPGQPALEFLYASAQQKFRSPSPPDE